MSKVSGGSKSTTRWMAENWRPLAAFVYLAINIFDFIIGPIFMGLTNESTSEFVKSIIGLDPSVQVVLAQKPNNGWQPLTLMGSGMFHISFGAILGVAAWNRGTEKSKMLQDQAYDHMISKNFPQKDPMEQDEYQGGYPGRYPSRPYPPYPPYYPQQPGSNPEIDPPEGD